MGEVCSVQGEQERDQDCSLWGPCTADNYVQHTVLRPLRLWLVGGVVEDPGSEQHRNTIYCVHRTNETIFYNAEETFVALYSSSNYHE